MPGFAQFLSTTAYVDESVVGCGGAGEADSQPPKRARPRAQREPAAVAYARVGVAEYRRHKSAADFDLVYGGFGSVPKSPSTMSTEISVRLHLHRVNGEITTQAALPEMEIVETSLQHMANGGIYDYLGGGFHRYSVDAEWLVPHFEKMLYDNALLSRLYLHAYLVKINPMYSRSSRKRWTMWYAK